MKVLVTGASGFVGRAVLASLVARGDAVHAAAGVTVMQPATSALPSIGPARSAPSPMRHTAALRRRVRAPGTDAVVHLAGIAHAGSGIAEERYDRDWGPERDTMKALAAVM